MNLQYLIKYKSFVSVEEMDKAVQDHINFNYDQLTESDKAVLHCLASHSLTAIGASHLLTETIANEIGVSVKTIYRATKKLTDLNIISKHKTVKRTGQGASIYVIAPFNKKDIVRHSMSNGCQSLETHVNAVVPTVSHVENNTVTKNLITTSFNPFVEKNVVTYSQQDDLKKRLKSAYGTQCVEGNKDFDELCKIAYGRLKQGLQRGVSYNQMSELVIKCMQQLMAKQGVRNPFALYSKMIERQTNQLFEAPVKPVQSFIHKSKEVVPDWFEKRHEPSTVVDNTVSNIDFEVERQKILAKLG